MDHEQLERYELQMGGTRGKLAMASDLLTDALVLVGQHGVYCASIRQPNKPAMDLQIIILALVFLSVTGLALGAARWLNRHAAVKQRLHQLDGEAGESEKSMAGASDFPGFPADHVLAAAPFAREMQFSNAHQVRTVPAGQRAHRATERGRVRIVPSIGVYGLVRD